MRILVIGDPHFKVSNISEIKILIQEVYKYLENNVFDMIVCLGDILDRHEQIHVTPLTEANDFLKQLSNHAPTYLLIGNHDRPNNSAYLTNIHPFTGLSSSRIHVVDTVKTYVNNDTKIIFVPYVPPGRWYEALSTCDFDYMEANLIFAHQEFRGCKMGNLISETEDVWPENYPYIISGHIHEYQVLQPNLVYVGTPLQHAFGDSEDKAIMDLTLENGEIRYQRVYLSVPKRKLRNIVYSDLDKLDIDELLSGSEAKLVRLSVSVTSAESRAANNHPTIKKLLKKGVKVHYKPIIQEKECINFSSNITFTEQLREKLDDRELELMSSLGYFK